MQESQINDFLKINKHFLDKSKTLIIKERLEKLDESKIPSLSFIQFRDPKVFFAISWFGGVIGLNRFLIGDVGMGILKLLLIVFTFFIPYLVDLFLIQKRIREKNYQKFLEII